MDLKAISCPKAYLNERNGDNLVEQNLWKLSARVVPLVWNGLYIES